MNMSRALVIAFTLVFLCFTNLVFSQSETDSVEKTHNYEICAGYCKPTGEFQFVPSLENLGYARPGISLFLNAKSPINKFLGFKYSMSVFINPVDNSIYHTGELPSTSLSIGRWANINLGLGSFYFKENDATRIEIGINIGLLVLNRPKISFLTYDNGSVVNSDEIKSGLGFGFGIIPEVALIQKMSDKVSLKFFINYLFAPSYVEYKKQHYFINEDEEYIWSVNSYTDNFKVSALNVGVGVIF